MGFSKVESLAVPLAERWEFSSVGHSGKTWVDELVDWLAA